MPSYLPSHRYGQRVKVLTARSRPAVENVVKGADVGSQPRIVRSGRVEKRPEAVDEAFRVQDGQGGEEGRPNVRGGRGGGGGSGGMFGEGRMAG